MESVKVDQQTQQVLRNALNRRYEEALGFPSPLLNFVSGVKWSFSPSK